MEPRFGHEFSRVRVHTDPKATASARAVNAQAYTVGANIVFGVGRYQPQTAPGRQLLAHELTHVIQQGMVETSPTVLALAPQDDRSEGEAERAGETVRPAPITKGVVPTAVARAPDDEGQAHRAGAVGGTGAAPAGGKALNIEFNAFIPGTLGQHFDSFPHARNLKNQATFDTAVAAVTSPNSWKPEPRKTEADVKDPGSARNVWFYSTDERGFGGGSHRVGFSGKVNQADIGGLGSKGTIFSHSCGPSHRVRSTDTGIFTSSAETGSVEGPYAKTAPVKSVTEKVSDSAVASTVETEGQAAYAFMPTLSPDIDYDLKFKFENKPGGGIDVSTWIKHNLFPYYEVIINGTTIWTYTSSDTGPTLTNLNSSKNYFVGPWPF